MNIEIANRLQKLRKENGYSQEELADKLGISRQAVSKWERAESSPDTDNLIILARLYNMSLDELLNDNESNDEIRERTIDRENESKKENVISLTDDEGQTLEIRNGHIKCTNPDGTEEKFDKKTHVFLAITDAIVLLLTLTGYLVWSLVFDKWEVSWVLWVLMPAVMSIFEAIAKKQLTKFVYPCLVTAVYCFLGMQFDLWHPYWFLFITIPFFYIICDPIDKFVFKTKELDEDDD